MFGSYAAPKFWCGGVSRDGGAMICG
jgi:hypothetical protein